MYNAAIPRSIVWLHLSDLHLCKAKTGWDDYRVLTPLLADLKHMEDKHGLLPQLLFFTGDAVFGNIGDDSGSTLAEQYGQVEKFIKSVRTAFSTPIPRDNVFLVPGNHDVDRIKVTPPLTDWLNQTRKPDEITRMIQEGSKHWKDYVERLHAYRNFLEQYKYNHLLQDKERLIYAQVREFNGCKIGIGGFNSAWSCCQNHEKGKLWLAGDWQSGEIIRQLNESDVKTDFRIALLHHPFGWFVEQEDPKLRPLFEREFQILLHGHEHQEWVHIKDNHIRIAAAACYNRSHKENGYNFVRLNLDSCKGEVWLRRYDGSGGGWVPCTVSDKTDDHGLWPLRKLHWSKNDEVIEFSTAKPSAPENVVLPPRIKPFIGRAKELEQVMSRLQELGCVFIYGLSGVGKTALASEVTWRLKEHFNGRIVYHFSPHNSFDDILNTIARFFLNHGLIELPLEDKLREIGLLLQQNRPTLVYLDDLRDPEMIIQVRRLSTYCSFLITGRNPVSPQYYGQREYQLDMMDRKSSIQLYKSIYYADTTSSDRHDREISEICEIVGDLPLAVGILASKLKLYGFTIQTFLERLRDDPLSMSEPWTASMNLIYQDLDVSTQRLFAMLSLFRGNVFHFSSAAALFDEEISSTSLYQLIDLLLVRPVGKDRYVLHPLIHEFASRKLVEFGDYSLSLKRVINWFLDFTEENRENFSKLEVELENILMIMDECSRIQDEKTFLRIAYAMLERNPSEYAYGFLAAKGFWSEGMDIIRRSLELTSEPDPVAKLYEHLGLFYYWKAENDKAMECYEQALKLCEQLSNYSEKVVLLHRIGFIESDNGNYNEAERVYRQSVELAERNNIAEEHLATGIHLVGTILYHQCRYKESKKYLEKALGMRSGSPWAASVTKRRLAGTYRKLGQISEAEALLDSCLEFERRYGNERNLARCLRQIGMIKQLQGKITDAHRNFKESHEIFLTLGNKKGIASILTNLGETNLALENIKIAKLQLQDSYNMAKEQRSRYGMAMSLKWLAKISYQRNLYKLAAQQALKSLSYFEEINHVHVIDVCRIFNQALMKVSQIDKLSGAFPEVYDGEYSRDIKSTFDGIWIKARQCFIANEASIDKKLLNIKSDDRRGISLIIRPSEETSSLLRQTCERLRKIAPDHHYYDPSEFHVTVMTLITASDVMKREDYSEKHSIEKLSRILTSHKPFRLYFRGIGATMDSVIAHGFFRDGTLDEIRRVIREAAPEMDVGWVADPYPRISAHVTLVRLRSQSQLPLLVEEIQQLESIEMGICPVDNIEFVFNDWYMSKDKVELIERFSLE